MLLAVKLVIVDWCVIVEYGLLGNTQNTRSFEKFLGGNPTRPPAQVALLPVGRRSSSQVTSAMSIPFSK